MLVDNLAFKLLQQLVIICLTSLTPLNRKQRATHQLTALNSGDYQATFEGSQMIT
jgi:hypothetical protein